MNNEEKILEMLAELTATQKAQGEMLAELTATQKAQGEMLAELTATQEAQGELLAKQGELLAKVDERSQRTAVLMEADLAPKLQTLYEGHGAIMDALDKLATKNRVEKLEDEIIILKTAFKTMNQRITELEKAQ